MAGSTFQVNRNKLAERCEVCHQSDLFDQVTGICQRCRPLPLEQLTEQVNIQTIPSSRPASTFAAALGVFCFGLGIWGMHSFFSYRSVSIISRNNFLPAQPINTSFYIAILFFMLINIVLSYVLRLWCSDSYNERLEYRILIWGKFAAFVGLIGSVFGLIYAIPRLAMLLK